MGGVNSPRGGLDIERRAGETWDLSPFAGAGRHFTVLLCEPEVARPTGRLDATWF